MQNVHQFRPAGPPATAYYNVPPGTQPIMTIHTPNVMVSSWSLSPISFNVIHSKRFYQ